MQQNPAIARLVKFYFYLITNHQKRFLRQQRQFKLIQQLKDEDKQTVMKIMNTMLTKTKFKDFFNKNIAAL